jgi:hypothetical protein
MTYGAAAVVLGWGATRAWLAETALVAEGLTLLTREGRAFPCPRVNFCIGVEGLGQTPVPIPADLDI